ncbi:VOC family protein [Streptomyces sp. NPDC015414]|uniref:VOC family protein n=1 Tax=Streptomyces sp. NPDC015414 TaxID=3364957 RepID=UPI0037016C04
MTARAHDIHHIGIAVHDADRSAVWYVERLGMRIVHDEALPHIGVRLVHLAGSQEQPAPFVQLLQPLGPSAVGDHLRDRGEGLHHVCLGVADVEAFLAQCPGQTGVAFPGARGKPCAFLDDVPPGVRIEITEHTDPRDRTA